ncbi:MAG: hypothetical protein IKA79_09895 [Lentisphaeria bacterium]|nr:hypothetical protein [Lentisphaeria bacterium]
MKKTYLYILASLLLTPFLHGEKGEFVANKNIYPFFAGPPPLNGKYFLNPVNIKKGDNRYSKIITEDMTKGVVNTFHVPLLENTPPVYNRLMVREIKIMDDAGNDITAKGVLSAKAENATLRYPERVTDKDLSAQSCSYTYPPQRGKDQKGWYDFSFTVPVKISSVRISSGRPRVEEGDEYINLASKYAIYAEKGSGWELIDGTETDSNTNPEVVIQFAPVRTKKLRIAINGQTSPGKVSMKHISKLKIPENDPFFIGIRGANVYKSFTDVIMDKSGYEAWKKAHPGFLGFPVEEWDNAYRTLLRAKDLAGMLQKSGVSSKNADRIAAKIVKPSTRKEALAGLKLIHDGLTGLHFGDKSKMIFLDCALAFNHYAMEWGCGYVFIETTSAGYQRHQPQMYFVRGASRQYGIPWGWYIAVGMNGKKGYTDPDYIGTWSMNAAGGSGGISPSLNKRDRYLAWLSGAEMVRNEVWPWTYCMDKDKDGIYELSPHGEVMKEWYDFIRKNPDRGVSYAPVALGLPFEHGVSPIQGGKVFGYFPCNAGDIMTEGVLRAIVPWMMHKIKEKPQEWAHCGSPYGDIYDVILPETPSGPVKAEVLKNYRAFFMNGEHSPSEALVRRFVQYVKEGGTLIINTRQLGKYFADSFLGASLTGNTLPVVGEIFSPDGKKLFALPAKYEFDEIRLSGAEVLLKDSSGNILACSNDVGKGRVILTTPCMLVHKNAEKTSFPYTAWKKFPFINWILDNLVKDLVPVSIDLPEIQYGLNILEEGILLYLFNNEGVHKTGSTAEKLDEKESRTVTIGLKKLQADTVMELRSGKKLKVDKESNSFKITIGPGDVAVIRIPVKDLK